MGFRLLQHLDDGLGDVLGLDRLDGAAEVWVPAMSSVLVNGGMITETSTPCGATSSASAADSPTTPNLAPT